MEVLAFVELLELDVTGLGLSHIGTNRQVLLITLSDEVFEFLLDLDLCQALLQAITFLSDEGWQVICYFIIGVEG